MTPSREQITGLVLAGGRGSRMGGVDKGLQAYAGMPLVQHALQRLAPQVGPLLLNANRSLEAYAALGLPVLPDAAELPPFPGPLAGMLAGLEACRTPWLACVPCDAPHLPLDLVARLAQALQHEGAELALAATLSAAPPSVPGASAALQPQPVFALLPRQLAGALRAALLAGERKIDRWAQRHACAYARFDDEAAFFNANTLADLAAPR